MKMSVDVAVIIVAYNSESCIVECLQSVLGRQSTISQEVIVVDNASPDQTAELVKRHFPTVQLVSASENLGFAAGVNLGATRANADYVLLLNPDTVVIDGAIDRIVEFAKANPEHGIYGGRTLKPDGSLEPSSCWAFPTLWSMGMFACGMSTILPNSRLFNPESMSHWQRDSVREVDVVTGCFLLVNAKVWQELGGLDGRFFMYGEDVDFGFRARARGYRPIIVPDAEVMHEIGESSSSKLAKLRLLYRGKATLIRTHWNGFGQSIALFFLLSGTALRALLFRFKSDGVKDSASHGWLHLWRERREWISGY